MILPPPSTNVLQRVVSTLFFHTSHHYIPTQKSELIVRAPWGDVQIWREYHLPIGARSTTPEVFVLRFLGSRGRAELASLDPADRLPNVATEVWTMNAPGFGASTGPANLAHYADAALLAHEAVLQQAAGRPVWLTGKSIGTLAALHVCAQRGAAALILRNPMPLCQLILRRYGWWNLWLGARVVTQQIPLALDNVANAARCRAPALFVVSSGDQLVPPDYQQRVIDAYAGENEVLVVGGGHDLRVLAAEDETAYAFAIARLRARTPQP